MQKDIERGCVFIDPRTVDLWDPLVKTHGRASPGLPNMPS